MAHVRSVVHGGEGKKRELGSHTFYDHDRILPGSKALTQHSLAQTFCHLSCGRSVPGSEKRKCFCAILSGPVERWTATSSRIIYPEVSFLRFGRGLSTLQHISLHNGFLHNRHIFFMIPLATFADTEIRCHKPKKF